MKMTDASVRFIHVHYDVRRTAVFIQDDLKIHVLVEYGTDERVESIGHNLRHVKFKHNGRSIDGSSYHIGVHLETRDAVVKQERCYIVVGLGLEIFSRFFGQFLVSFPHPARLLWHRYKHARRG